MQQGSSGASRGLPSGTGGQTTSPFGSGANLLPAGNPVLGHHSQSTGHLQPQTGGASSSRGGEGGMWGNNRADPFADLGNVKTGGAGSGLNAAKPSTRPQMAPQAGGPAVSSRPGYQYFKPSQTQSKPGSSAQAGKRPGTGGSAQAGKRPGAGGSAQAGKASYQPNYSSSVLGNRAERGPRLKTGQPYNMQTRPWSHVCAPFYLPPSLSSLVLPLPLFPLFPLPLSLSLSLSLSLPLSLSQAWVSPSRRMISVTC